MRPLLREFTVSASAAAVLAATLIAVPPAEAAPTSYAPTELILDATAAAGDCSAVPGYDPTKTYADLSAKWSAPTTTPTSFQYEIVVNSDPIETSTRAEFTRTCVPVGLPYDVKVSTVDTGLSPVTTAADSVQATIEISKQPQPELSVVPKDGAVDVRWRLNSAKQYPAATSYTLEYKLKTDTAWKTFEPATADVLKTSATITGLTNGGTYEVRVSATNFLGRSEPSLVSEVTPIAQKNDQNVGTDTTLETVPLPTEVGSWCTALLPPDKPAVTKRKAQQLMAGTIDFGKFGRYWIDEHPNWKPQSTADTAGNRHVHSLNWAMPLLYRGIEKQKPALVDRFKQLLYYWIDDHQTAASRTTWIKGSIYGGRRTETLVCAAQTLNDEKLRTAALRDAAQMLSSYWGGQNVAFGTNNTDIIRQTGAFAAYCWVGDVVNRDTSWANLTAVARNVVFPDGSDVEGSPGYAQYIEELLVSVEETAKVCGTSSEPIPTIRSTVYNFLAHAVRPDFVTESLGDTVAVPVKATLGVGDARAEWMRSGGTTGTSPTATFATFQGGYAFGRSKWAAAGAKGNDSFYSLRFTGDRPATAHTHDDGGSLTFYSNGVEWIGDPGPYRYDNNSSLRGYMLSRSAHSSYTVSGVPRTKSVGVKLVATPTTDGNLDTTCVKDATWGSVAITRCVRFDRSLDALVAFDTITAAKIKAKKSSKRVVTQRWQLPTGVVPTRSATGLTLSKGNAQLEVIGSETNPWRLKGAKSSSSIGWFTGKWGVKERGAVASRTFKFSRVGGTLQLATVLVPHAAGTSASATVTPDGVQISQGGRSGSITRKKF